MTVNRNIYQFLIGSLILLSISLVSTEYVPVYIWDTSKSNEIVPALPRINQETFKEIVQEKLDKKSFVVIFAEPNLSAEDFRAVNDVSGKRVYSQIPEIKASKTYLPLVDDPIGVIKSIYGGEVTQVTIKDFDLDKIKTPVVIVDLDDVQDDESRSEILQRHDESIGKIYKDLRTKKGDAVAIYTGYHTSWITPEDIGLAYQSRNILQATTRADEDRQYWNTDDFLLFVSSTAFVMNGNSRTNLTNAVVNSSTDGDSIIVNMTTEVDSGVIEVRFEFSFFRGYWFLNNVNITINGVTTNITVADINAPEGFSYQCTNQVFAQRGNTNTYLSLPGMQVQVFRTPQTRFGDPYYCVGFTTAPIWSGIFVTAILVSIMAVGLSMMMDIKTMDRFDDPKGKTIQINAAE